MIGAIVDRVEVPPGGFPIPFVEERHLLETANMATGVPQQTIAKLLRGITVSRANMVVEGRKVWKPKQEHRAYRRAFFDFPHPSGAHLTWSDGMAKESLLLLIRDLAFQHIPPEWEAPSIRASLSALSNRCGKEFERVCCKLLKERGFVIASGFKDGIGVGQQRLLIPPLVGELDCVAYAPDFRLLLLLECKLVQSGTEAARLRDDIHQFTNPDNGYFLKFQRKLEWLRANAEAACRALESIPGVAVRIQPTHLAAAVVTLFPSFASLFNPPAPCVSIGEFFYEWDQKKAWPFPDGITAT